MQRKYLLLLTGINCILVLGLVAWVFHLQTRRPVTQLPAKNVEREVLPFETLRASVESAADSVEKRQAVLALPNSPESLAVLETVLEETPEPEDSSAWVQLQKTALEKYAAAASDEAVFEVASAIAMQPARPIPVRDHALRIAIHKAAQVNEAAGNETMAPTIDTQDLIEKALSSKDTSLHGTALLGLSFLYNKDKEHIAIEAVREPVKTTLEDGTAMEHSVICALQAVIECPLQNLEPLVWARIEAPQSSEAVLLRAISAMGVIGEEEDAARLAAMEPRTPEQFQALTNSVGRIRQHSQNEGQ